MVSLVNMALFKVPEQPSLVYQCCFLLYLLLLKDLLKGNAVLMKRSRESKGKVNVT